MKKIYRLKSWYTLEQAAERLSITLGEPVTENDVIQMAAEDYIALSWYLTNEHKFMAYQVTGFCVPVCDAEGEAHSRELSGIFYLPADMYTQWSLWFLTLIGKGSTPTPGRSPVVIDPRDHTFWVLYNQADAGDFVHYPNKKDLVVTREDIEVFERLVNGFNADENEQFNGDIVEEWIPKARALAQKLGERQVIDTGAMKVTARSIHEAVTDELAKDNSTHGKQGPRSAHSVRTVGLREWIFCPPNTEKNTD